MMDNITAYKIWVPDGDLWAKWTKPVLFAQPPVRIESSLELPSADWARGLDARTMIIVDLPGKYSLEEGLALASKGRRPVAMYNGVNSSDGCNTVVPVNTIVAGLYEGAEILKKMKLRKDLPPAFLLDANRMTAVANIAGSFDNRWCLFPQDMPSASFLLEQGVQRVVVRSESIQEDLTHVLCRYQEKGIAILHCTEEGGMKEVTVSKPHGFRDVLYRLQVIAGLERNSVGGFGGMVPMPSERTYGHG